MSFLYHISLGLYLVLHVLLLHAWKNVSSGPERTRLAAQKTLSDDGVHMHTCEVTFSYLNFLFPNLFGITVNGVFFNKKKTESNTPSVLEKCCFTENTRSYDFTHGLS